MMLSPRRGRDYSHFRCFFTFFLSGNVADLTESTKQVPRYLFFPASKKRWRLSENHSWARHFGFGGRKLGLVGYGFPAFSFKVIQNDALACVRA